jgi:peptide/nickel transport system permease protein/oligopeptide transport system permease protein
MDKDKNNTLLEAELEPGAKLTDKIEIPEENIAAETTETDSVAEKIRSMFRNNKLRFAALIVLGIIIMGAVFAPLVAPNSPNEVHMGEELQGPSLKYPLGTDEYGRCILSRLIHGSRVSLIVGFVPSIISMTIGVILGLLSGFFGGAIDFVIMRLADIVLAFPSFLLALLIMYTFDPSLLLLFMALSLVSWAGTARVVRSQTLSFKEKEFVEAARSIGVRRWKIILKHILPNCVPSLIVLLTLNIPSSIMTESSLSFLGVGIQPPQSSWGLLVNRYRRYIFEIPVAALAPGLAILIVVLAFNFLGDGLRDAMDPYMEE